MGKLVLRVYIVGPRGGLGKRDTFRGEESEELTKTLNAIFERRKMKPSEDAAKSRLRAAKKKSSHSLRRRTLKSGMMRWTCRKCRRCIDMKPDASKFQTEISMIVDHGMGNGRSWIAGRKGEKPVKRAPSGPVCMETKEEREEMDKNFRKHFLA